MNLFSYNKSFRLLNKHDFNYLREKPNVFYNKYLKIFYKKSIVSPEGSRLGISVSKKVGNAVLRNKIKRLSREYFRNNPLKNMGLDLLIVYSPNLKDNPQYLSKNIIDSLSKFSEKLKN